MTIPQTFRFYERFLPFINRLFDEPEAVKALIDGYQLEYERLCALTKGLIDLVDVNTVPCEFLPFLADLIGLNLEACDPCDLQREQVRNAIAWYKEKGTADGYKLYLRTLGFDVNVIELFENGPDCNFSLPYFGKLFAGGTTGQVALAGDLLTDLNAKFIDDGIIPEFFLEIDDNYFRIIEVISETTLRIDGVFPFAKTATNYRIIFIESWFEDQGLYKDSGDASLPTFFYNITHIPPIPREQAETSAAVPWDWTGPLWDDGDDWDDPLILFDTAALWDDVVYVWDGVFDFNERLPGFHAASRIIVELFRLPEAENLELCGLGGTALISSQFGLSRIVGKIRELTPVHVDAIIKFVIEITDDFIFLNDINPTQGFAINDFADFFCCCYYGYGALVSQAIPLQWDEDPGIVTWDFFGFTWDDIIGANSQHPEWDTLLDWDGEGHWDNGTPLLSGQVCFYDQGFSFNYSGFVQISGTGLSVSSGSDIVTDVLANFTATVDVDDFLRIDEQYFRIIDIPSATTLQLAVAPTFTGSFDYDVIHVESFHALGAVYRDPLDIATPGYFYSGLVLELFNVNWDTAGQDWDDGDIWDDTGIHYDCCQRDAVTDEQFFGRSQGRIGEGADGSGATWLT